MQAHSHFSITKFMVKSSIFKKKNPDKNSLYFSVWNFFQLLLRQARWIHKFLPRKH